MENITLEALEQKINTVLTLVQRLKEENNVLKQKNQELQSLITEKDKALEALKTDSETVTTMKTEIDSAKQRESRIRSKVEDLLNKLQEFEDVE